MAGILQSIMAKLGPKAGAKELAEFLAKKGTKYSTIAKELETIGLPKHEVDLIRSTLQGQEEIASKTMLKAPKPTGAATGSNVRSSTKITKDASELLTDAKTLVADMRKANRPEAEIEASLRATYPDLEDVTIRNFMGPEIPKVSSAADDLAVATPVPGKAQAQPDYDREARLKELIKQDKYKPVTDVDKWDQVKLADSLQNVKDPKAKAPKAEKPKAAEAPTNPKAAALDSLDDEVAPPPDPFSEVSDEIEVQPKPFNIDEAPEMGATGGVKDDPVDFDMSVGDNIELTPMSPAGEAAVNPAKLDLQAALPPGKDQLRLDSPKGVVPKGQAAVDRPYTDTETIGAQEWMPNSPKTQDAEVIPDIADAEFDDLMPKAALGASEEARRPMLEAPKGLTQRGETAVDSQFIDAELSGGGQEWMPAERAAQDAEFVRDPIDAQFQDLNPVGNIPSADRPMLEQSRAVTPRGTAGVEQAFTPTDTMPWDIKNIFTGRVDDAEVAQAGKSSFPSKTGLGAGAGALAAGALIGNEGGGSDKERADASSNMSALPTPAQSTQAGKPRTSVPPGVSRYPEVKGTQVPGGVAPTGEIGQAQSPIKQNASPVPPGAQEFSSADPSTDPRRRGPATGAAKPGAAQPTPKPAEAAQSAMNATNKVQEDSAEIEKKVPGWNDALKAALTAQVSGLEKIQAELRDAQARAGKDFKDDMFNARMGEALTAFAQAMVKYAAASEGVRKKLDIAPNYKPQPADFTNVFKAIDSDFQQKIAALRESAQTASTGIATANKQLMDTAARADNQQFQQGQANQKWERDLRMKQAELQALEDRRKAGQEFTKEMWEKDAQLKRDIKALENEGAANYAGILVGKTAAPVLGAENAAQKNANDWQEADRGKLNKILENKSSAQRQRELKALASQLGVEPVITPGTLWDSLDEDKTTAAIRQAIEKGRSNNPNTPVAAQLRSVLINSLSKAQQDAIANIPNGSVKSLVLGGREQLWQKQDGKLILVPQQ